jgi:hypothetical protein
MLHFNIADGWQEHSVDNHVNQLLTHVVTALTAKLKTNIRKHRNLRIMPFLGQQSVLFEPYY